MRGAIVLVTGASGFIGRALVRSLVSAGAEVHAVGRRAPLVAGVMWHAADLARPGALAALETLRPWTHLFHLANASVQDLSHPLEGYLRLDMGAVGKLVDIAQARGACLVAVGSGSVYRPSERPHREDDPVIPLTPYAEGKLRTERLLVERHAQRPFPWTLVRLFGVYGPGESPARLVPTVIRALLAGQPAEMSQGAQVRDFLFLQDAVDALMALAVSEEGTERILNVGSGEGASVREVAGRIGRLLGREDLLEFGAPSTRPHDCPRWVADIARMRRITGWGPRVGWEEGLSASIAWWRKEGAV